MLEAKTRRRFEGSGRMRLACFDGTGMENLERLLADRRRQYLDMSSLAPDPKIVDLFRPATIITQRCS